MTTLIESTEQDKNPSSVAAGIGSQLRKARKSHQLSQIDVAEQLYLEEGTVDALENDDYDALPEAIFVKGYIRNYSRLVGLNSEALIKLYEDSVKQQPLPVLENVCKTKDKVSEQHTLPRWQILSLGAISLVLLLLVYAFNSSEVKEEAVVTKVFDTSVDMPLSDDETIALDEVSQDSKKSEIELPPESSAKSSDSVEATPQVVREIAETIDVVPAMSTPESVREVITTTEIPPVGDHVTMTLSFIRDSWVEISDATGQRLYFDLAKDGSEFSVSGVAPFDILLGYAIGVTIQYNGEPFDLTPYIRGKMARLTLGKAGDKANSDEL